MTPWSRLNYRDRRRYKEKAEAFVSETYPNIEASKREVLIIGLAKTIYHKDYGYEPPKVFQVTEKGA